MAETPDLVVHVTADTSKLDEALAGIAHNIIELRARAFLGPRPEGVPESTYLSAVLQIVNLAEQLDEFSKKASAAIDAGAPPADDTAQFVPPQRDLGAYL